MKYVIIINNKVVYETNSYDDACDQAFALETIYNTSAQIKEKNECTSEKHVDASWMF